MFFSFPRLFDERNLCAHAPTNPCFDKTLCVPAVGQEGAVTCSACPPGYKGDGISCRKVLRDPCTVRNPCHPGSPCVSVNGVATCGPCPDGMSGNGKVCHRHDDDPCRRLLRQPCFPGVACVADPAGESGYACGPCPTGLVGNGTHCVEVLPLLDPCIPNPCFDGVECSSGTATSTRRQDGFKCGPCPLEMTGDGVTCSPVDPCISNPCHPGVACLALSTRQFACGPCPAGTVGDGTACVVSPCASDPCHPGVPCLDLGTEDFACGPCPTGLTGNGVVCKEKANNPCVPNPCFPGVSCSRNGRDDFDCGGCPPGFSGDGIGCTATRAGGDDGRESPPTDPCSPNPCFPGVQCVAVWKGTEARFSCGLCPDGG